MKKLLFTAATLAVIGMSNNGAKAQVVTTLAGNTTAGSANGTGATASFHYPAAVTADGLGNLYVADQVNNEIRKIVIATGVVSTLAGSYSVTGSADGIGAAASFNLPAGVCIDASGNLYVADEINNEIRKIVIATGVVSTFAGSTTSGSADGTGGAASFNLPGGICTDGGGNLYVADIINNEIRKIVIATGVVSTFAGSLTSGHADGTGAAASFYQPLGVCTDGSGNLYVGDQGNNTIRKIVIATGVVTTLAGSYSITGSADGTGAAASFNYLEGVCSDGSGNLYVADEINNEIRKIVIATGAVSTLAGSTTSGSANGTGAAASFYNPGGVCSDGSGNLYVADEGNNEIRMIGLGSAGINQFGVMNEVSIYPNPAKDVLNVECLMVNVNNTLVITDMLGNTVKQVPLNTQHLALNISNLNAGVYNVNITSNEPAWLVGRDVVNKRIVIVK